MEKPTRTRQGVIIDLMQIASLLDNNQCAVDALRTRNRLTTRIEAVLDNDARKLIKDGIAILREW